MKSSY